MNGLDLAGDVNRTALLQLLARALSWADGSRDTVVLMLVDLDPTGRVQLDGNLEGFLVQIGRHLVSCVGPMDTVMRLGGTNFGVIVAPNPDPAHVRRVATKVLQAVREAAAPEGRTPLQASVGVAQAPMDGQDGPNLLECAAIAVREAQAAGGDRVCFFAETRAAGALEYQRRRVDRSSPSPGGEARDRRPDA